MCNCEDCSCKNNEDITHVCKCEEKRKIHLSDCAVHNEPAFPAGPCDCGCEKD